MRVLAVTNMYPTSRAPALGTFVEQQIVGLRRAGVRIELLFADRVTEGMGVYLHLRRQLRSSIASFDPEIVHVMYGGIMAGLVTHAVRDRPTLVTFHGSDLLGEKLSGFVRHAMAGYGVRVSWRAARRADGIVVVAKHLERALPADVEREKIRIIPCGIDLERFRPMHQGPCRARLGWSADRFHIVFPSNGGNPVKRPQLARAAVETARRLGVPAEIHFLRGVPNEEVPVWINASDVLLVTSLHEGSPTVVKEALACGVPVVSVKVGDVEEQLEGLEGCHLSGDAADELAAKLEAVYQRGRRLTATAKVQTFSLDVIASQLKEFYRDVLTNPPSRRSRREPVDMATIRARV